MQNAFVLRPGQSWTGDILDIYGDRMALLLPGSQTDREYTILENRTEPMAGPPLHRHNREDEWLYILDGDYVFEVDGERFAAGPGCFVYAPQGSAHTFQNVSDKPGRMLVLAAPAGLDEFFIELSQATMGTAPDPAAAAPIFHKYGLELLGPPLAARAAVAAEAQARDSGTGPQVLLTWCFPPCRH